APRSAMARVRARKCKATGLGGCQETQGMRAAYSQSTRASTGSVLLRSPSDSAKRRATRIDDANLHLAVRLQGQRQIQAVIFTGFQADSYSPAAPEQVGHQGFVSRRMVWELSHGGLVVTFTAA